MTSLKKISSVAIVALALFSREGFCLEDGFQSAIHESVEQYGYPKTEGKKWEADKKNLVNYPPDQIVRALITEIDLDRGSLLDNRRRDVAIYKIFRAMELPPTTLCHELDISQSPQRKASLMFVLRDNKSQEVIQALLRQLKDHRPAVEPYSKAEGRQLQSLRVCDVACNTLADSLITTPHSSPIGMYLGNVRRDEIIQQVLAELKLSIPE